MIRDAQSVKFTEWIYAVLDVWAGNDLDINRQPLYKSDKYITLNMSELCLSVKEYRTVYNWFFSLFYPSYKDDPYCSPDDVMLMKRLERWLLSQDE